MENAFVAGAILGVAGLFWMLVAFAWRRVVRPNEVHIVQNEKKSVVYGVSTQVAETTEGLDELTKLDEGNAYYAWPTWIPRYGVQVVQLPLAVFDEALDAYEAYDVGKVPFVVDVVAFFRISMPTIAAQRISDLTELQKQLKSILQGAVRTVLAQHDIEQIMMDRSTFGELFTALTKDQLAAWGVVNVKNIELMDIRDHDNGLSSTVANIMAKKQSLIQKESKIEVANNNRDAKVAELAAKQDEDVRAQEMHELVGKRTAEKDQQIGIAIQRANQEIQKEAAITKDREMEVLKVQTVRTAEITKEATIVAASQQRDTMAIEAEGQKQQTVIVAEGVLAQQQREAEGKLAVGTAEAEAKRLFEMSLVSPQIELAHEIGENEGYQTYLVKIRNVEKDERVGVEQAKALQAAAIKVIANTGNVTSGVSSVMDLFSSKGGTELGAMTEGFAQTEVGAAVLNKLGVRTPSEKTHTPSGNGVVATEA